MLPRYNCFSLFVSLVDVPVGLGSLFQPIASISHLFYLPRYNKLPNELVQNDNVLILPHRNQRA